MRYRKGSIAINDARDIPLLLLIRDSRAITLQQLYEELFLRHLETSNNSAYWRLRRLVDKRLIEVLEEADTCGNPVYTITHRGLSLLESKGHSLLSLGSFSRSVIQESEIPHMTELNSIRIAMLRSSKLVSWKSEMQIVSENLALFGDVSKDYDAEIVVKTTIGTARFALEFERTAKSASRYREIREMIDGDSRTNQVLYLTSAQELLFLLLQELRDTDTPIAFGLSADFKKDILEMPVIVPAKGKVQRMNLDEFLSTPEKPHCGSFEISKVAPAF
jgi:hypothetical protein